MVESSTLQIDVIAAEAGFSDPDRMRRAFIRAFGQPPQAIKRAVRQHGSIDTPGIGADTDRPAIVEGIRLEPIATDLAKVRTRGDHGRLHPVGNA